MASAFIDALVDRHSAAFTRPELLKAIRSLSSRYVEDRARLGSRSPLDSAGKRAAFAAFYAPLHYLTTAAILRSIGLSGQYDRVVDLGCGTGVAAIAWADVAGSRPTLVGIDRNGWALDEMRWNCRQCGLECRTHRASMVTGLARDLGGRRRVAFERTGIVCGWSLNELAAADRQRLCDDLIAAHEAGASVLAIEPIAGSAAPWWSEWRANPALAAGRFDQWRFPPDLPPGLADLDAAAGFRRDELTARSFWLGRA